MEGIHRFDRRVEDYDRYRPGYPDAVAGVLVARGVRVPADVVDIGAGTGKLALVFVRAGHRVTLIEPGDAMRAVAERDFGPAADGSPRAVVRSGRAEATGLADRSVDAIVAGQAFHWFEPVATRAEWRRVLRPGGVVLLAWNERRTALSPVLDTYEKLLVEHCPEYEESLRRTPGESHLRGFLGPSTELSCFEHEQVLDLPGLIGRATSASYVPRSGPAHDAIVAGLQRAFERHALAGRVRLPYETRVFHGLLD